MHLQKRSVVVLVAAGLLSTVLLPVAAQAAAKVLHVYLLVGQSNMEGQAYTYDNANTAGWNIPTMEFLLSGSPAASNYLANLPHGFKGSLQSDWLNPRDDVWGVHYDSNTRGLKDILPTADPGDIVTGIQPLMPGFGVGTGNGSMIGAELGMGIRLGDALDSPVFLFKSDKGGTTLGNDWRPPTAVNKRGGSIGPHYANTIVRFKEFLDALDADRADDGVLNNSNNYLTSGARYQDAIDYRVAGVFWFQGWNEKFNDGDYSAAELQAEYKDNLKDLIYSIRAEDVRIPNDLPLVIGESSDQLAALNAGRIAAAAELNAEIPSSAAYFDTDNMIGVDWGDNDGGAPFSQDWGFHFHARAENFLEIGWKAAGAVLDINAYEDNPSPLRLTLPLATDATTNSAAVEATISTNASLVTVYWDTTDRGATTVGWIGSSSLGVWTGGRGQVPASLTGLLPDTRYHFRFWATSVPLSTQAWTSAGTVVTDFEAGRAPSGLSATTVSARQIDLTWSEDFGHEAGFLIRRADDSAFTVNVQDLTAGPGATSYSDDPLDASSTYYYKVAALSDFGQSDFSGPASAATDDPPPLEAGLTAYYDFEGTGDDRFDDPAGAFADDLLGRHNPAFSSDTPGAFAGSQSASFDGSSALFTDAYTTDLQPSPNAYTIMFWIKGADADQENNNTRLMTSRIKPNGSSSSAQRWQVEGFGNSGSNGDKMDVRLQSSDLPAIWFQPDAVGALANGVETLAWHHVAFVLSNSGHPSDGGAYGRTFVDGVQAGNTLDPNVGFDLLDIGNQDGQFIIGGHSESAGSRAFTGLLDDVALFSGIVTDADIAAIAAGTLSPADFISSPVSGGTLVLVW